MTDPPSRIVLPPTPADQVGRPVAAWAEPVVIDTYEVGAPDPYPAYLERRVYQGSSGRVYPLPFFEHIEHVKRPHTWVGLHLENRWVRLMILPELGGRIQVAVDKTNDYDFFYRNNVIKPALVGLTGPWVSGGVEFNWPQHHRPATYLPTAWAIEAEPDGAVTIWCSDHDPFARMKGAHGIRLRGDSSVIEARVRVYNRSEDRQSFLWWSNVAVAVNDDYQSFFPTDVHDVADHAKRATATYPAVSGRYYGIDYPARVTPDRPDGDRLDWYRNIPVPTSYMVVRTADDFFGGYDHGREAGFVYWADHRLAPGKKQWTWGNSPFGHAWDRQLTDADGPYIELMAGAYTDNQPDFSWLAPGETRTLSQYWYPMSVIGPAQQATREAALAFRVTPSGAATEVVVGVAVTRDRPGTVIEVVDAAGDVLVRQIRDLAPDHPTVVRVRLDGAYAAERLEARVVHAGQVLVAWRPAPPDALAPTPAPVRHGDGSGVSRSAGQVLVARHPNLRAAPPEPLVAATVLPLPDAIDSVEQLYLAALHLVQYRHATRDPEQYLVEALRRDPADSRSALLLATLRYRAGQYAEAAALCRVAVERLTALNPNPVSGEAHYRLGLAERRLGRDDAAADAFGKAAWDVAWRVPAQLELARLHARAGRWDSVVDCARTVLACDKANLQATGVTVVALRALGRVEEAGRLLNAHLAAEPLDWWAVDLAGGELATDPQTVLDVVLEYAAVGCDADVARVALIAAERQATPHNPGITNAGPLAYYYRARALRRLGDEAGAREALAAARSVDATTCLAGRLDDADLLASAVAEDPGDARAHGLLGHWLYFQRRYDEAREHWQAAVRLDPTDAVSWRNLAVAAYNVDHDAVAAEAAYEKALAARPADAKLWYERDQLAKRRGVPVAVRLATLADHPDIVAERDDLTVEWAELLTAVGRPAEAVAALRSREFGPWEGGEGKVLAAWDGAHLALARRALARGQAAEAADIVRAALAVPVNLGEERHPLGNYGDLWVTLGEACGVLGATDEAVRWWRAAALVEGDFQDMRTVPYSEMSYYAGVAWRALGESARCDAITAGMVAYAAELERTPPQIDYFATSLPTMLLFHDDLVAARDERVVLLRAGAAALTGNLAAARAGVATVLAANPSHPRALALRDEVG